MTEVTPVPAFEDNYIWLIEDPSRRYAAIVDPGDADPVLAHLEKHRLTPVAILITHHHYDHTGGVREILARHPVPVYGPGDPRIPAVDHPVGEGDGVSLNRLELELAVLATPGHTTSHIVYHGDGLLFCGDTLFTAGCGRLFEGTPAQMSRSLDKIAALPDDTGVFCAHEYTLDNLRFALVVEPDNPDIRARRDRAVLTRAAGEPTVPATLELERQTNPFLRSRVPAVVEAAEAHARRPLQHPEDVFGVVRSWKDELD